MPRMVTSSALNVAVFVYMFVGYTAYSKVSKRLQTSLLMDVLLLRKGLEHTAVEANKVVSLVAIMLLGVSQSKTLCEYLSDGGAPLVSHSLWLVLLHSVFSAAYFGAQRTLAADINMLSGALNTLRNGPTRKRMDLLRAASIVLGVLSSFLLLAAYGSLFLGWLFLAVAAWLAVAHFWSMEVDFKFQLQVRPAALLVFAPFVLAALEGLMTLVA